MLLLLFAVWQPDSGAAQVPKLLPLPENLSDSLLMKLTAQRSALDQRWATLRTKVEQHNGACSSVPANSPKEQGCRQAQAHLNQELATYREAANAYNHEVANALKTQHTIASVGQDLLRQVLMDLERLVGFPVTLELLAEWRTVIDAAIGQQIDVYLQETYGFRHDATAEARLHTLVAQLTRVSLRRAEPMQIRILNTDDLTRAALSSPTTVYVGKGYLALSPSENELLFVLGHELSHAQLGHALQSTVTDLGMAAREVFQAPGPTASDPRVAFALQAGATPQGLKEGIDRVRAIDIQSSTGLTPVNTQLDALTSSHPTADERLSHLERAFGTKFWDHPKP